MITYSHHGVKFLLSTSKERNQTITHGRNVFGHFNPYIVPYFIFVPYMLRLVLANEQLYTKSKDIVIHFKLVKITEIHVIWYLKL